jgi:hypothetical protein
MMNIKLVSLNILRRCLEKHYSPLNAGEIGTRFIQKPFPNITWWALSTTNYQGGKSETPGVRTPLVLRFPSQSLRVRFDRKVPEIDGLRSSIQGRKNFGFSSVLWPNSCSFQWETAISHRKNPKIFRLGILLPIHIDFWGFVLETVIFLDLSDRFRSFWYTGILDLGCTPLVLHSYSGVLESRFFPLANYSLECKINHVIRIVFLAQKYPEVYEKWSNGIKNIACIFYKNLMPIENLQIVLFCFWYFVVLFVLIIISSQNSLMLK